MRTRNRAGWPAQRIHDAGALHLTLAFLGMALVLTLTPPGPAWSAVIEISTIEELQRIGNDPDYPLDGDYALAGDIDASATRDWNDGAGFVPIGKSPGEIIQAETVYTETYYTGSFNGRGHRITGLFIHRPGDDVAGLFGMLSAEARIEDVQLLEFEVSADRYAGGLAGVNYGEIHGCVIQGAVMGDRDIGGLVGGNGGTIRGCQVHVDVREREFAGGRIRISFAVGGLTGYNTGYIEECVVFSEVLGNNRIGGLVGHNTGLVADCEVSSLVDAWDVGGGLAGYHGPDRESPRRIRNCHVQATARVFGNRVGGLVGWSENAFIEDCHVSATVRGGFFAGGLTGSNQGGLTQRCSATGSVEGSGLIGGLIGNMASGEISHCYSTAEVIARSASGGGLIGRIANTGYSRVEYCYALGSVHGRDKIGGLVGSIITGYHSVLLHCYAAGAVTGTTDVGGLVGHGEEWANNSFWDVEATGIDVSTAGTGATTAQMRTRLTFLSRQWDFEEIWDIQQGRSYPFFQDASMYPLTPDRDDDGKPDGCEFLAPGPPHTRQTHRLLPDSDGDGLLDGEEDPINCPAVTPLVWTDPRNADTDGNGLLDGIEVLFIGSDPLDPNDPTDPTDTSGDGMPDFFAIEMGLDPANPDSDGDGFSDAYELLMGTDPLDPDSRPTLGDVNDDGETNNQDAIALLQYFLSQGPAPERMDRADTRADGQINNLDAIVLFSWLMGHTPILPVR